MDTGADQLPDPRREAFARLMAKGGRSYAQCYLDAGYQSTRPDSHGSRLAANGKVAARIAYLSAKVAVTAERAALVDAHRVRQELEVIALSDIGELFESPPAALPDSDQAARALPRLKALHEWPDSIRRAVASVKVRRPLSGEHADYETVEFKLWDKVAALRLLSELAGDVPGQSDGRPTGVVVLPMMMVPQPGHGARILDASASGEVAVVERASDDTDRQRRRALLDHVAQLQER